MVLPYRSVHAKHDIFGMKRSAARIVPKLPTFEQKESRKDIAQNMLTTLNDDPDLLKT